MYSRKFHSWINKYFYRPRYFEVLVSMLLSPLALIYTAVVLIKFKLIKPLKFPVPIISVGNLVVGGTGKTPLTKAIFNEFSQDYKTFIILRGYKRSSRGLIKVCIDGNLLCDVYSSGDEAMEYVLSLKNANVIVSEDRKIAINEAISLGAELIILDDGFGKFDIFKFNILLKPAKEPPLNLTLPSGAYRYPKSFYKFADFIPQDEDILKANTIANQTQKMVLTTAIANPFRLKDSFKECIALEFFPDHHKFSKLELEDIIKKHNATSLLVTQKDFVKIKDFGFELSILELNTQISPNFKDKLNNFIKNYN